MRRALCTSLFAATLLARAEIHAGVVFDPILVSSPPSGTALTCDGPPGSTQSVQIELSNRGIGPFVALSCNLAPADGVFSIAQPPPVTLPLGADANVIVACRVPAPGAPAAGALLSCSTPSALGSAQFPLSSSGQALPFAPPATVPSATRWSLLALTLAVLALAVRRRQ